MRGAIGEKSLDSGRNVALTGRIWLLSLIAGLLFAWPLLLYGRPSYYPDSATYYKGGRAAVTFAAGKLLGAKLAPPKAKPDAPIIPAKARPATQAADVSKVAGIRSIPYSVFAYLLSAPGTSLTLLALAQALGTGLVVILAMEALAPLSLANGVGSAFAMAVATPLALVCVFAMPDIYTGVIILIIAVQAMDSVRYSIGARLVLAAASAFAISAHASNPPVALAVTVVALLWLGWTALKGGSSGKAWLWIVAPLILGLMGNAFVNRIGVGEASPFAKRYPLTLARSVSDGPARWYLEKNCPRLHYAVCEIFPGKIPPRIDDFLWSPTGIKGRATPQQMDRIRDEEATIVLAAAREYWTTELSDAIAHGLRQLVSFRAPADFAQLLVAEPSGTVAIVYQDTPPSILLPWVNRLAKLGVIAALGWIVWRFRRLSVAERVGLGLIVIGILANDGVAVLFSGIADRYEARVIWLLPLFALALGVRDLRNPRPGAP